ncbi:endonuclease/exonuclease/phosphatase family protein [Neolewinella sp.]|uniref:endonuclease/exonuclease/phosphatase family protein n=1 Tax=Neolewinella sp. TaxID=2993543 RepID=UPI003B5277E4
MGTLRTILYYIIIFVSTIIIVASLFSLVYDVSYWYSKVLDFPRTQYLIAGVGCLLLFSLLNRKWNKASVALTLGLLAAILIQSILVLPYLVGERPVPEATADTVDQQSTVGILLANVLITNEQAAIFLDIVRQRDADMVLVMEVNDRWMRQLQPLEETYAHTVKHPTDNSYGMTLYSKFPLEESEVMFFNHDDVPSIHTQVQLPSGKAFWFHGVHPVAPVPKKKYPDNRGEKEVALGEVAELVAAETLPAIVAGDFNDVSWSRTARLFENQADLRNVRLGRGLYSTFDANSWIMRWPLDHYFVTESVRLLELERLPAFGSDHFPMYARFAL